MDRGKSCKAVYEVRAGLGKYPVGWLEIKMKIVYTEMQESYLV